MQTLFRMIHVNAACVPEVMRANSGFLVTAFVTLMSFLHPLF